MRKHRKVSIAKAHLANSLKQASVEAKLARCEPISASSEAKKTQCEPIAASGETKRVHNNSTIACKANLASCKVKRASLSLNALQASDMAKALCDAKSNTSGKAIALFSATSQLFKAKALFNSAKKAPGEVSALGCTKIKALYKAKTLSGDTITASYKANAFCDSTRIASCEAKTSAYRVKIASCKAKIASDKTKDFC